MGKTGLEFEHIHLISEDPKAAAAWYVDMLDGEIVAESLVRNAPQIAVRFGNVSLLIRSKRKGESPGQPSPLKHFADYISHDTWGTDHFGFRVYGNLDDFCHQLRKRGATFSVEPYDFVPGARIAYIEAPDGVSIELVQAKPSQ